MKLSKRFTAAILSGYFVLSSFTLNINTASAASNSSLMTKYLKCYKQGNYTKAASYLKKMKKSNKDTSLKAMSSKMKNAYLKIVEKYNKENGFANGGDYLWGYYLADLNKDKQAELIFQYGSCEADVQTYIYTFKKGKAKLVDKDYSAHSSYCPYEGKGVVVLQGHMGVCSVGVMSMKGNKVNYKNYGEQDVNGTDDEYCNPSNVLYDHVEYDKDYNRSLDFSDLK